MNSVTERMKSEELKALKKNSEQAYRDYLSRLQQKEVHNREKYKNELDQCDELQRKNLQKVLYEGLDPKLIELKQNYLREAGRLYDVWKDELNRNKIHNDELDSIAYSSSFEESYREEPLQQSEEESDSDDSL